MTPVGITRSERVKNKQLLNLPFDDALLCMLQEYQSKLKVNFCHKSLFCVIYDLPRNNKEVNTRSLLHVKE